MNAPQTYAEWTACFDALREGLNDEVTVSLMERGKLSWTSGVAERFCTQLFETVNFRLDGAAKRFQRNLDMAQGNETAIVTALLGVKRELKFLRRVAGLPVLPEEKREYLTRQITEYARNTQQSLENSAKGDRTGRLGSLFRNNRVDSLA